MRAPPPPPPPERVAEYAEEPGGAPPPSPPLPTLVPPPHPNPAYWTQPLPLTLLPPETFTSEQLTGRYGLPLPLPSTLHAQVNQYESWCKAPLQLDRVGVHARPIQSITFQGQVDCIRGFLGFTASHFNLDLESLNLSLYQDAANCIAFISFLKVCVREGGILV